MNKSPEGKCFHCGKPLGNYAHKWLFDPRTVNHDPKIVDAEFCSPECALFQVKEPVPDGAIVNPEWEKLQNEPETIRVMDRRDFISIESRNK